MSNNILRIVNDQALQKRIDFYPHPAQQEILDGMKRFTVINAGRRFGKSKFCAYLVLRELLASNRKIWVVAPTYDLTRRIFNYVEFWITKCFPRNIFKAVTAPTPRITSTTHSILEGRSTENILSLMGDELDLVILDEASSMSPNIWQTYLYPSLMNREGRAFFISTPKGQNWFFRLYIKAKKNPKYASFKFESKDNPSNSLEEIEEAKNTLPKAVFDQEYQAMFLSNAAAVFRNVRDVATGELRDPQSGHNYIMGVDLGQHKDFTVITVIDRADYNIVHLDKFNNIGWPLQIRRIVDTSKSYNDALINIDSTGTGDPIAEEISNHGLAINDFKYTNMLKVQLVLKLASFIEHRRITYPYDENLLDELEDFGYNTTKHGNIRYSAPEGGTDDYVNSLALAVWELNEEPDGEPSASDIIVFPITAY